MYRSFHTASSFDNVALLNISCLEISGRVGKLSFFEFISKIEMIAISLKIHFLLFQQFKIS